MITKTILLVIAYNGYQPLEYGVTRKVLEDAGFSVKVASNHAGSAHAVPQTNDLYGKAQVDITLDTVDVTKYDGIFLIGGSGALRHLDNETMHTLIQKAYNLHIPLGAICISPRILAKAGVLTGKSATGWNDDKILDAIFNKYGVSYVLQPVVVDGTIITADGPLAAHDFGKAIVKTMKK